MTMPVIYSYSAETGEYTESRIARENPRRPGVPVIPAHATLTKPPVTGAGQIARWTGASWQTVADHRGLTYWTPEGEEKRIADLGDVPPTDAVYAAPTSPLERWDGSAWTIPAPTLAERRAAATMRRTAFVARAVAMGLLPASEAIAAGRGEWPATFAPILLGMDAHDAFEAELAWASAQDFAYRDELVQGIASAIAPSQGMTATELLDAFYGLA